MVSTFGDARQNIQYQYSVAIFSMLDTFIQTGTTLVLKYKNAFTAVWIRGWEWTEE